MDVDLSRLSDDELAQLIGKQNATPRIQQLLSGAEERGGYEVLLDEAERVYWDRRFREYDVVPRLIISELLSYRLGASTRNVIGEAAMYDKIDPEQIEGVLDCLSEEEWSFRQVTARKMVNDFVGPECSQGDAPEMAIAAVETINNLLETRCTWAVIELLPKLGSQGLGHLRTKVSGSDVLTRHDRHVVREAIKKLRKRRQ